MYEFVLRWLRGYLLIGISGRGRERFLDLCAKNNIELWNIETKDNKMTFTISRKNSKKLPVYQKKTGVNLEIKDKRGLPFFFYKYRKRKCFAIGFLLCIAIIYLFTLFVWDVNINGESSYTKEQIREDIIDNYVRLGTLKRNVDCAELEKTLREKYDKIAWISCELKGTQLNINMTETIPPNVVFDYSKPCNIVASCDGVITDIITKSGTSIAHKGDEIKKGDILISGVVNIYNDFDELIETEYLPAKGDVYALVTRTYEDEFPLEYYEKEYGDNTKKYYGIRLGNNYYQPIKPEINDKQTDIINEEYKLKLAGDFYLPIAINVTKLRIYKAVLNTYTDEEAFYKADKRLSVYLDDLRKKEVEILENNVKIEIVDGVCRATGTIVTKELIGVPSDITIIEQGETQ